MGLSGEILSATLLYRRRGLKRQTSRRADLLFAAWATAVLFIRFTLSCALAVRELRRGSGFVGRALAEFCSLQALGVALLFTFLVTSLCLGTMSLDRRRLLLSPVPFFTLYLTELAGLLASPVAAIVAAFVLPAAAPLLLLPQPVAAACGLLLCFAAAICLGGALSLLLSVHPRAERISGPFRVVFAAVMIGLLLGNFDYQWKEGPISLFVFGRRTLLDDGAGAGLLALLRPWSPSAWIAARGVSPLAGLLLAAGLAASGTALFALALCLALRASARGPRATTGALRFRPRSVTRGSPGVLMFRHELRVLTSRAGTRLGALAALGCAAWTLAAGDASANIPLFGAIVALGSLFPYASNLFGADGQGLRRYLMLSPDWGVVFASRNAAHGAASAALLLPLVGAAAVRISAAAAVSVALSGLLVAMLHCLWGIMSSMLLPSAERGPADRQPPFVNQIAVIGAWAVPLALHRAVAPFGSAGYDAALGACLLAAALLYGILLRRTRRHFAEEVEAVLERM